MFNQMMNISKIKSSLMSDEEKAGKNENQEKVMKTKAN